MSFFVKASEDGYALTSGGYAAVGILLAALLILASVIAGRGKRKHMNARQLVFCAMSVALASVLSMLKVYEFPFGGAVTLCSMLFICLPGYFYGLGAGLLSATAYGVLQFLLGPYILFPIQIIVDYLLAFGAFGLSGLFAKSRRGLLKGYIIGILGRYVFSVLSGWLFFGEYAWAGWGALSYSLAYNAAYIFAEGILTIVILMIPSVSKALARVKEMAIN
ncbi:energy-coupled thiamine transporter ThiT [Ruminococcus sp. OA3]|uniref:energy-coupled thiamine transporter ThiT n=1 Tax=Ruminococcus sp. OA3 TaxID=2914164 RepID=UPI001F052B7C|nr:energy-coupled thiamine transporter ThiT [Ruminococcus sp. OA3]MCH1982685.1 energy-coupled thiamine transporter ThiT [Ruminococcus sp. OA3]